MTTFVDSLNNIREETILTHYRAAEAELKDQIKKEPLKIYFHIYTGCVSREIAGEIAHRFNSEGIVTVVKSDGLFGQCYYLSITFSLPDSLVHEKKSTSRSEETIGVQVPLPVS